MFGPLSFVCVVLWLMLAKVTAGLHLQLGT